MFQNLPPLQSQLELKVHSDEATCTGRESSPTRSGRWVEWLADESQGTVSQDIPWYHQRKLKLPLRRNNRCQRATRTRCLLWRLRQSTWRPKSLKHRLVLVSRIRRSLRALDRL